MDRIFTAVANRIAAFVGQPVAFIGALLLIVLWASTGPLFHYSDTWQLIVNTSTTIITFLIVFLIQNSQNRDAAAIQAKLDEIIRSIDGARDGFIGIEHLSESRLQQLRTALEKECEAENGDPGRHEAVERLLGRL